MSPDFHSFPILIMSMQKGCDLMAQRFSKVFGIQTLDVLIAVGSPGRSRHDQFRKEPSYAPGSIGSVVVGLTAAIDTTTRTSHDFDKM
jgi:hypothetical protein